MADRKDITVTRDEHVRVQGNIICIEVGTARKIFHIHDALLTKRSPYFKQALERMRLTNKRVYISEVDIDTFDLYVQYVYSGRLACKKRVPEQSDFEPLVDLYLAAEKFKDSRAMDAAVNSMLVLWDKLLPLETTIRKVYESTTSVSKLRKLFVDMFIWEEDPDTLSAALNKPLEFLQDLSQAALAQLKAKSHDEGVVSYETAHCCDYHEHREGAECNNRKRKRDDSDDEASEDEES